jgi:1-pyrroline-5-carboxylate dehydrogenase
VRKSLDCLSQGFILAISPFNFNAIGVNLPTAPALMGNTVLWKPATTSVLGNYYTYKILQEAGMPASAISFLPSDGSVIGAAINDKDFGGLHFTGSTKTFNYLWKQIGDNLNHYRGYPRIVGETGGKNFHLIHPSADVEHVVNNTIRAAFEYQGQKCSACSRLYVPKSLWEGPANMKGKMVEGAQAAKALMGQPDDFKNFMTAVIDKAAYKSHTAYLDYAKAAVGKDCEILAGGHASDDIGYFIEPTIIQTSNPHFKTMQEEIFGPILTVYVYDDGKEGYWQDVMTLVDTTTPYALTGAIFSTDRAPMLEATHRYHCHCHYCLYHYRYHYHHLPCYMSLPYRHLI